MMMKGYALILVSIFLAGYGFTNLLAQEANTASGGEASGSGGSASYSIGQIVYAADTATTGSLTPGVQQAFEIYMISELENVTGINLKCEVFPNPATNFLSLMVENYDLLHVSYQLYDINGRLVENKKVTDKITPISMANLSPSSYFLIVRTKQSELKTFKIIMNK